MEFAIPKGRRDVRVLDHPTQIRRMLDSRLSRLSGGKPVLAASLVHTTKHCGRDSCHCRQGGPLHTAWHLTFKGDGHTRTVYVPLDLLDTVRQCGAENNRNQTPRAE